MTTTYAGFEYPKFLADLPSKPIHKRLEEFKKGEKRPGLWGYRQNNPCPLETQEDRGRTFYHESDFAPGLRFEYCDQVENVRGIDHKGWYTDPDGISDTIRGVVFRLPHNKGFLAGWTMGESVVSEIEYYVYDDIYACAHAADRMAQRVAEKELEANTPMFRLYCDGEQESEHYEYKSGRLAYYDALESKEYEEVKLVEEYQDPDRNEIIYQFPEKA